LGLLVLWVSISFQNFCVHCACVLFGTYNHPFSLLHNTIPIKMRGFQLFSITCFCFVDILVNLNLLEGNRPPAKIPVPLPPSPLTKNKETLSRPLQLSAQGHVLEVAIEAAAIAVIDLRDSLNEWDGKVGDGDCGSTMFRGASAIVEDMKKYYPLNDQAETVNEIGSSIRRVMGGTSGIIYDIFCKAAYTELKAESQSSITALSWARALEAAIAAVSKYGGASEGYRTLLDALVPASKTLKERLTAGDNPVKAFVLSAEAAVAGAESTKDMKALAGRSTYVSPETLASVPDPGAMAAACWYKAAATAVKNHSPST
ncbi:hypothetical protein Leryth_008575, partial [Lithospermum erythrorhizon]